MKGRGSYTIGGGGGVRKGLKVSLKLGHLIYLVIMFMEPELKRLFYS